MAVVVTAVHTGVGVLDDNDCSLYIRIVVCVLEVVLVVCSVLVKGDVIQLLCCVLEGTPGVCVWSSIYDCW